MRYAARTARCCGRHRLPAEHGPRRSRPALEPNGPPSILITSLSGTLYVLNSRTGETIWTSPGSEAANAVPVTMNQLKVGGHAAVVMDGDRTVILVPAGAAGVIAFDWSTKAELWRSPSGFPEIASPVPVDLKMHDRRGVVVASANGTVWVLALADGKPLWHLSGTLKSVEADPMVADLMAMVCLTFSLPVTISHCALSTALRSACGRRRIERCGATDRRDPVILRKQLPS